VEGLFGSVDKMQQIRRAGRAAQEKRHVLGGTEKMRIAGSFLAVVATIALVAGSVQANDAAEMADLQARIATLEAKLMAPAGGGDAASLTSKKMNGAIKIGGGVELTLRHTRREDANSTHSPIGDGTVNETTSDVDASLKLYVDAGNDTSLYLKLDLEDEDDIIEEANFTWKNVRGSNWTLIFGEDEMPFGQDKNMLITDPFTHGAGSVLVNDLGEASDDTSGASNVHQKNAMMAHWLGEQDNNVGLTAQYGFDMGKVEAAVFQNHNDRQSVGQNEDRSNDQFQSFAARVKLKPMEGLELSLSGLNLHNDFYGADSDDRSSDMGTGVSSLGVSGRASSHLSSLLSASSATAAAKAAFSGKPVATKSNTYATSLAFNYETSDEKWYFHGEYIHTWNAGYYDDLDADVVTVGANYAVTPKVTFALSGDWASMDNDTMDSVGVELDEDMYRVTTGVVYKLDSGIELILEYAHEWYDSDINNWQDADLDSVAFRTCWSF
jgi:hypothetical protein